MSEVGTVEHLQTLQTWSYMTFLLWFISLTSWILVPILHANVLCSSTFAYSVSSTQKEEQLQPVNECAPATAHWIWCYRPGRWASHCKYFMRCSSKKAFHKSASWKLLDEYYIQDIPPVLISSMQGKSDRSFSDPDKDRAVKRYFSHISSAFVVLHHSATFNVRQWQR